MKRMNSETLKESERSVYSTIPSSDDDDDSEKANITRTNGRFRRAAMPMNEKWDGRRKDEAKEFQEAIRDTWKFN